MLLIHSSRSKPVSFIAALCIVLTITVGLEVVSSRHLKDPSNEGLEASNIATAFQQTVQPKITWSQPNLNLTLSPDEQQTRTVSFVSSLPLTNITIEAVPEIAPFLNIQPSTFESIGAKQPQSVRITFSIPHSTTLTTYEGTMHLRVGNKTLPQTFKIELNVWQTFTDSNLQLSFKYPPTWLVGRSQPTGESGLYVHESVEEYPGEGITIDKKPGQVANELTELNSHLILITDTTQTVNGINWRFVTHRERETAIEFVSALAQQDGYVIRVVIQNKPTTIPTFLSLLQTFSVM